MANLTEHNPNKTKAIIEVAVGIIKNSKGDFLIAKRKPTQHLAGLYEFPGGKLEPGETGLQALIRELKEEVGIVVVKATQLFELAHDYDEKSVNLNIFLVDEFTNEAVGLENQQILWVAKEDLHNYPFPQANQIIIKLLSKEV